MLSSCLPRMATNYPPRQETKDDFTDINELIPFIIIMRNSLHKRYEINNSKVMPASSKAF